MVASNALHCTSVLFSDQLIYLALAENSLKLITAHSPVTHIFIVFIFAFRGLITARRTYYSKHLRSQFTVRKIKQCMIVRPLFQIFYINLPLYISHPKANIYYRTGIYFEYFSCQYASTLSAWWFERCPLFSVRTKRMHIIL